MSVEISSDFIDQPGFSANPMIAKCLALSGTKRSCTLVRLHQADWWSGLGVAITELKNMEWN